MAEGTVGGENPNGEEDLVVAGASLEGRDRAGKGGGGRCPWGREGIVRCGEIKEKKRFD